MRRVVPLFLLLFAACAGPQPAFRFADEVVRSSNGYANTVTALREGDERLSSRDAHLAHLARIATMRALAAYLYIQLSTDDREFVDKIAKMLVEGAMEHSRESEPEATTKSSTTTISRAL